MRAILIPDGADFTACMLAVNQTLGTPATPAPVPTGISPYMTDEPTRWREYVAGMGYFGMQASDFLEMAYDPAGLPNAVNEDDFAMWTEAGVTHARLPASCSSHANLAGVVPEKYLLRLDEQILWMLKHFQRVVFDPLHHYLQWKADYGFTESMVDGEQVKKLTNAQHAKRATAIWRQLATRYKDVSLRLSFDLFNEPNDGGGTGVSSDQLNAWHAEVIPAIRATGGKNVDRMVWMEPWRNNLKLLKLDKAWGHIGVQPHYYDDFGFTHFSSRLNAGVLAQHQRNMMAGQAYSIANDIAVCSGESGSSVREDRGNGAPRSASERAEHAQFLLEQAIKYGIPTTFWGANGVFAYSDQKAREWLPYMREAFAFKRTVRAVPEFLKMIGARLTHDEWSNAAWPGFSWDPANGRLTHAANNTGQDITLQLVMSNVPVTDKDTLVVYASDYAGDWVLGITSYFWNTAKREQKTGMLGVDERARTKTGGTMYPGLRSPAPGGFTDRQNLLATPGAYLGLDCQLKAGSPAGFLDLTYMKSTEA